MGIEEVVTAPRSPWQSPYVERVIGSIRRECLDHVIVLNERHLRAILLSYIDYYQRSRTHLALGKDTVPSIYSIVPVPSINSIRRRNPGILGVPATGLAGCTEGRPVDDEARCLKLSHGATAKAERTP